MGSRTVSEESLVRLMISQQLPQSCDSEIYDFERRIAQHWPNKAHLANQVT